MDTSWMGIPPFGYRCDEESLMKLTRPGKLTACELEHGHRNSGFTNWKWWCSIVMLVIILIILIPWWIVTYSLSPFEILMEKTHDCLSRQLLIDHSSLADSFGMEISWMMIFKKWYLKLWNGQGGRIIFQNGIKDTWDNISLSSLPSGYLT